MIEVHHLWKSFAETPILKDITFKLEAGKTLALIGSSGSGKTTILRLLNRLIEPDRGQIRIEGTAISTRSPVRLRRKIGYAIQGIGLFPHLTVAQNIAVVPQLLKWEKKKTQQRVGELLEKLQLPPEQFREQFPHQLSGGQQQRVGIARALAARPPLLLMDEPFGALDPIIRSQLRQEIFKLDELGGKTIVMVTHDVEEAFEVADRVCILDKGAVQQFGTKRELLEQPANAFVRDFLRQQLTALRKHTYTLSDLTKHLKRTTGSDHLPSFSPQTRIQEVMERLRTSEKQRGEVRIGEQTYTFDLPTLAAILYQKHIV